MNNPDKPIIELPPLKRKPGRPPNPNKPFVHKSSKIGRPTERLPESWIPRVKKWADEGLTRDHIYQNLLANGVEVTKESINAAMHAGETLIDQIEKRNETNNVALRSIDSALFDNFRVVIDDFIEDGRSIERIHAYLTMEGFAINLGDLAMYIDDRRELLKAEALEGPLAVAKGKQFTHTRTIRRFLIECWHNMPPEKRYTERLFGVLLTSYSEAMRYEIDKLRVELVDPEADKNSVNAEIEQKLGIALDTDKLDDEQNPSGAEAAMGATV